MFSVSSNNEKCEIDFIVSQLLYGFALFIYLGGPKSSIGSNETLPSLSILALRMVGGLDIGAFIPVTTIFGDLMSFCCLVGVSKSELTSGCASAISLTSEVVNASFRLEPRVCSKMVVGPWNCKNDLSAHIILLNHIRVWKVNLNVVCQIADFLKISEIILLVNNPLPRLGT